MASRSFRSGRSIVTRRSNRPGRRSAGSKTSGRFVAAITITFSLGSKPSISTRIWFSVCSRSSLPPPVPVPRIRPTASISSMKMMAGAAVFATRKRSRTREAPTPTNISTNSEPEMEKKDTPASPATARASNVFPVPGLPMSNIPFGIRAPISKNFFGFFKKSTISDNSCFASFAPATSLNVIRTFSSSGFVKRARDCPKLNACTPEPLACRVKNQIIPARSSNGKMNGRRFISQYDKPSSVLFSIFTFESGSFATPRLLNVSVRELCVSFFDSFFDSSVYVIERSSPDTVIEDTFPAEISVASSDTLITAGTSVPITVYV